MRDPGAVVDRVGHRVPGEPLVVVIETLGMVQTCAGCGRRADLKARDPRGEEEVMLIGRCPAAEPQTRVWSGQGTKSG